MIYKNGSKGEVVKQIQKALGVEQVGNFGPKTEAAVKEWQKKNGLPADGIVGPATLAKMGIVVETKTPAAAAVTKPEAAGSLPVPALAAGAVVILAGGAIWLARRQKSDA